MDFANERYVRLYTRDTTGWKLLGWEGQAVFALLYRKADRSGVIDLSDLEPWEAAVLHCGLPEDVAKAGTARCLKREWIVQDGDRLVFPKYIEANETPQSDAQRQRESRARRAVTKRDAVQSQNVTDCHERSHDVTPRHSVPSRALREEELSPPPNAGAREDDPVQVGADFMLGLFNRHFHPSEWREQLARIGLKPASERAKVKASIQADAYCLANKTHVKPSFVLRQWDDHLAGNPAPKPVARVNGRYAGPSRVATAAEYEADKTERAPWET